MKCLFAVEVPAIDGLADVCGLLSRETAIIGPVCRKVSRLGKMLKCCWVELALIVAIMTLWIPGLAFFEGAEGAVWSRSRSEFLHLTCFLMKTYNINVSFDVTSEEDGDWLLPLLRLAIQGWDHAGHLTAAGEQPAGDLEETLVGGRTVSQRGGPPSQRWASERPHSAQC